MLGADEPGLADRHRATLVDFSSMPDLHMVWTGPECGRRFTTTSSKTRRCDADRVRCTNSLHLGGAADVYGRRSRGLFTISLEREQHDSIFMDAWYGVPVRVQCRVSAGGLAIRVLHGRIRGVQRARAYRELGRSARLAADRGGMYAGLVSMVLSVSSGL
jgi:hypothetical protein